MESNAKGLIHVYTGNGKGKTTAAVGISLRAKSRGLRVLFAQFFKEKESASEISLLEAVGIDTIVFDGVKSPYFNPEIDIGFLKDEMKKALVRLGDLFSDDKYDLAVLDEFICVIAARVLTEREASEFIGKRPLRLEMILTGNGAPQSILDLADYVTYMQNLKHPYERNMSARKGIEF